MLTVTTRGVPRRDQSAFWESAIREHYFAVDGTSPAPPDQGFAGRMDRLSFGGLYVDRVMADPYRVVRSTHLAKRAPSESLIVFVLRRGHVIVEQRGRAAALRGAGDFAVVDSAGAYGAEFLARSELTMVSIRHPSPLSRLTRLADRTAVAVSGREGLAALAGSTLLALLRHVSDRDDDLAQAAARNAVDLVTAALVEQLEPEVRVGSRAMILAQAQRFMLEHIAEPELAPTDVAAAIPISERYLFSIFRDEGTTPAEWLRHARLERARDLLTAAWTPDESTIQEIACAVGLPRASHFSRLFRERFEVSPRECRSVARDGALIP